MIWILLHAPFPSIPSAVIGFSCFRSLSKFSIVKNPQVLTVGLRRNSNRIRFFSFVSAIQPATAKRKKYEKQKYKKKRKEKNADYAIEMPKFGLCVRVRKNVSFTRIDCRLLQQTNLVRRK